MLFRAIAPSCMWPLWYIDREQQSKLMATAVAGQVYQTAKVEAVKIKVRCKNTRNASVWVSMIPMPREVEVGLGLVGVVRLIPPGVTGDLTPCFQNSNFGLPPRFNSLLLFFYT